MLFVLGFILAVFGFALVVLGDGPCLGGKRIPRRAARWAGAVWLSYFPLVFGVRFALAEFGVLDVVRPTIVYGILAALCLIVGLTIIMRATRPVPGRRPAAMIAPAAATAFPDNPEGAPASAPPASATPFSMGPAAPKKKPQRSAQPENNPFDFS